VSVDDGRKITELQNPTASFELSADKQDIEKTDIMQRAM